MRNLTAYLAAFFLIAMPLSGCRSMDEAPEQGEKLADGPASGSAAVSLEDRENALQTMKAMRIMAVTCEAFNIDNGRYPKARSIAELADLVTPVYYPSLDPNDAWGNEFEVRSSKNGYEIRSLGRDGKRDKHDPSGMTGDLDADLVFSDAAFAQYPFGE